MIAPKSDIEVGWSPIPGRGALGDPSVLASKSDFEIALALIDFSPLERVLAQHYVPSRKGQVPFHPVSLFLTLCLRRELGLSWRATARLLASPHGANWRVLFGFAEGPTPSACRHFRSDAHDQINPLRALADQLSVSGIRFLGSVDPDEMPKTYDAADIFVNSSLFDNQPVSILEAFSAGLPVVSTSTGDIASMLRGGEAGEQDRADQRAFKAFSREDQQASGHLMASIDSSGSLSRRVSLA